jgi:hypothetical protein
MRSLTVRLPENLVSQIEAESRARKISKSDVVRERLVHSDGANAIRAPLDAISDLIGSVDDLPPDLSARRKTHLKASGYGLKHHR